MSLQKAIDLFGSQTRLAEKLGVHPMVISHWKKRGVPAGYCRKIEGISNRAVTAEELRPDIFGSSGNETDALQGKAVARRAQ